MMDIGEWISKRIYEKQEVKSLREIKAILLGCFYGGMFVAQMIGWLIVDYMGNFGNSIWCITGTAILMTIISCSMYLLLRKLYQRVRGIEETTLAEEIYEMFRTD